MEWLCSTWRYMLFEHVYVLLRNLQMYLEAEALPCLFIVWCCFKPFSVSKLSLHTWHACVCTLFKLEYGSMIYPPPLPLPPLRSYRP